MSSWLDDLLATLRVRSAGTLQTKRGSINFAGAGAVVTDDPTNDATTITIVGGSTILPATATPLIEAGSGSVGVATKYAREDHTHPAYGGGGGSGSGLDYTIDFRTQTRDYKTGIGAGSGTGGDNAQTVAFTVTANNGTTAPSTLASGLTLTPVSSANAGIMESGSNGLRQQITSGFAGKLADWKFSLTQLGIDRSRPFTLWLLINRTQFAVPSGSEAGFVILGNFVAGVPKVSIYSEHATFNAGTSLRSACVGNVNGTYTASEVSLTADLSDNVKVSRFSPTSAEFFTTASVASTFPTSSSIATFGRRGRATVDGLLMAPAADTLYIFPNDDDELRLRARADSTTVTMGYYALRVVQAAA